MWILTDRFVLQSPSPRKALNERKIAQLQLQVHQEYVSNGDLQALVSPGPYLCVCRRISNSHRLRAQSEITLIYSTNTLTTCSGMIVLCQAEDCRARGQEITVAAEQGESSRLHSASCSDS